MKTCLRLLIVLCLTISGAFGLSRNDAAVNSIFAADLPNEGRQTLALIRNGGPFPYSRDGIIFGNYEKRLPIKARGYYREYTVRTPWRRDRGPRRIIAGQAQDYYYTEDHYRSFRRIVE